MTLGFRAAALGLAATLCTAPFALGHTTDFILVKVIPGSDRVDVELTADYGGNPMFPSRAEAQAVLEKVLEVEAGGADLKMKELAPFRFEERAQFDPTAPIPLDAPGEESRRQLLTAVWSWKSPARELSFKMPEDAGQSVILWTPPDAPGRESKWAFVLPGESSPRVKIPHRSWLAWGVSLGVGSVGIAVAFGTRPSWRVRRRR